MLRCELSSSSDVNQKLIISCCVLQYLWIPTAGARDSSNFSFTPHLLFFLFIWQCWRQLLCVVPSSLFYLLTLLLILSCSIFFSYIFCCQNWRWHLFHLLCYSSIIDISLIILFFPLFFSHNVVVVQVSVNVGVNFNSFFLILFFYLSAPFFVSFLFQCLFYKLWNYEFL